MHNQISRYHRQIILPEFGSRGQQLLTKAKILVVGAGALGAAALLYLAPAGVGTIGILDNDELEITNLHRQVLYATDDVGMPKAIAATNRLKAMNPEIRINTHFLRLNVKNALDIIKDYDLVIECSDNFPTKFLVNDACVILNKPCVIGAAIGFSGQLSVYNYKEGPTYRCLMPEPPDPITIPTCANAGVMGMIPGIIGTMQALEAIKIISGIGDVISGRLLHFEGLDANFIEIQIQPNPENKKINQLTEYEYSCPDYLLKHHSVSPNEFLNVINNTETFEVVAISDIHDTLTLLDYTWKTIPLYKVPEIIFQIPENKKVMLVCENGIQNFEALKYLLVKEKFNRAFALTDGLEAVRFLIQENVI
jgi:sulfur-carrier protein adenylyltransferase/sulfurtransferase